PFSREFPVLQFKFPVFKLKIQYILSLFQYLKVEKQPTEMLQEVKYVKVKIPKSGK
ncbi:hypothetical protein PvtlMGM2_0984, partial [Prevotella sp. MGM2]